MNKRSLAIEALRESGAAFQTTARAYPQDKRTLKPSAKAFSATEIVYHMLAVEQLWQDRITKLLSGGSRDFIAMDPDQVALENKHNTLALDAGLVQLASARDNTLVMLRGLSEGEFELSGMHTKYGEMNIDRILEIMMNHDHQHAAQLARTEFELGETSRDNA